MDSVHRPCYQCWCTTPSRLSTAAAAAHPNKMAPFLLARMGHSHDLFRALRTSIRGLNKDWRRRPGRLRHTWLRTLEADLQPLNHGLNSAWWHGQDRGRWRQLVEMLRSSPGLPVMTISGERNSHYHRGRKDTDTGDSVCSIPYLSPTFLGFYRQTDSVIHITAEGDGTCTLATEWGRKWLARWHKMTPSCRAPWRSSGSFIFTIVSTICQHKPATHVSVSHIIQRS